MKKSEVKNLINQSTDKVTTWFASYPREKFEYIPESKNWSTGQHLLHLIKVYKAINLALRSPKLILRFKFGKRKHTEQTFEQMQSIFSDNYSEKKYEAPENVTPGVVSVIDRMNLMSKLDRESTLMIEQIEELSEKDLSKYVIPHPFFGKLTFREFIMFNSLHNEHHLNTLNNFYL
jgi:uncharacterized damage-inducible protein DinB